MPQHDDAPTLSPIERILALRSGGLFAGLPDDALAAVGAAADEVTVPAGETVFAKGDPGDAMYVVVAGALRVHDGDQTFQTLGAQDVFGEMALLDAEARSASVTALDDCLLLRLDQEAFDDLLEEQASVARGVIRVLSERLRARMADVNSLRAATGRPAELAEP